MLPNYINVEALPETTKRLLLQRTADPIRRYVDLVGKPLLKIPALEEAPIATCLPDAPFMAIILRCPVTRREKRKRVRDGKRHLKISRCLA